MFRCLRTFGLRTQNGVSAAKRVKNGHKHMKMVILDLKGRILVRTNALLADRTRVSVPPHASSDRAGGEKTQTSDIIEQNSIGVRKPEHHTTDI